jgi:hypothetical protein
MSTTPLTQNYTKVLVGEDFTELSGNVDFNSGNCLAFSFGGPLAFPTSARRLSEIARPCAVSNAVNDYEPPNSILAAAISRSGMINEVLGMGRNNGDGFRPPLSSIFTPSPFSTQAFATTSSQVGASAGGGHTRSSFGSQGGGGSGAGGGLNTCINLNSLKSGTAAVVSDPVECDIESLLKPTDQFVSSIQAFFLLFRMMQCFPDELEVMDKISQRLEELSGDLSGGCDEYILEGSGYPSPDAMRRRIVSGHTTSAATKTTLPTKFVEKAHEVWDIRSYMGGSDFWNGPVRDDVSVYMTMDLPDYCSSCETEHVRSGGASGESFGIHMCDHLPSMEDERYGGMLPVRRYVMVLEMPKWTNTEIRLRINLAFWCLQNKLLSYDYGAHIVHALSLSVYTKSVIALSTQSNGGAGGGGVSSDDMEEEDLGDSSLEDGERAYSAAPPTHSFVFASPGIIKQLYDSGKLPHVPPMYVKNRIITDGSNIWYDVSPSEWATIFETYLEYGGIYLDGLEKKIDTGICDILSPRTIQAFRCAEITNASNYHREEGYHKIPTFYHGQRSNRRGGVVERGRLIDPRRSFLCSGDYLRDWPMLWKQHLPHYSGLVATGPLYMFPGLHDVYGVHRLQASGVRASRQQIRQIPNGSTTISHSTDYKQHMPTNSYIHRDRYRSSMNDTSKKAFTSERMRGGGGVGIPSILHECLNRTFEYCSKQYHLGWYLYNMRSEEANISDTLRVMYMKGTLKCYNPSRYMANTALPFPFYTDLSLYSNYMMRCLDDLRVYYHADTFKLTILNDFVRMIQDCFREERSFHLHAALVSDNTPGVGKSWMPIIASHLLPDGMFKEVGYQSKAAFWIQLFGRENDSVVIRDESSRDLFSSRSEGSLGDPKIKLLLSSGYIKSNIFAYTNFATNGGGGNSNGNGGGGGGGGFNGGQQTLQYQYPNAQQQHQQQHQQQSGNTRIMKRKTSQSSSSVGDGGKKKKRVCTYGSGSQYGAASVAAQSPSSTMTTYSPFLANSQTNDGSERRTVDRTYEALCVWVVANNINFSTLQDVSMLDRFFITRLTKPARNEEGARIPLTAIVDNVPISVTSRWRALVMAHMEVQKLIMTGAMTPPNANIVQILKSLISTTLKRHAIGASTQKDDERDFQRVSILATIGCVQRVVLHHFMLNGGLYYKKDITPTRLRSLEPFMVVSYQDAVFALGSLLSQILPTVDRYAFLGLRRIWTTGTKRTSPFEWAIPRCGVISGDRYDPVTGNMVFPKSRGDYTNRGRHFVNNRVYTESISSIDAYALSPPSTLLDELEELEGVGGSPNGLEGGGSPPPTVPQSSGAMDAFDYNYVIVPIATNGNPVPIFAKMVRQEIVDYMRTQNIENVSIPEFSDVETWVKKQLYRNIPNAKKMVHVVSARVGGNAPDVLDVLTDDAYDLNSVAPESKSSTIKKKRRASRKLLSEPSPPVVPQNTPIPPPTAVHPKEQPPITNNYACHMDNVISMEKVDPTGGKDAELYDVKCMEIIPKIGIRISTFWLKYCPSPYEELCSDLKDIHSHNILYSTDYSRNKEPPASKRSYHNLLLGCQDQRSMGRYQGLPPGDNPGRISDTHNGMKIPVIYCPEGSLSPSARSVYSNSHTNSTSRDSQLGGGQSSCHVPKQNLDEIVMATHLRNVLTPCIPQSSDIQPVSEAKVLTELDLIMSVSFLVVDTKENRRLAAGIIERNHIRPWEGMAGFVSQVQSTIPSPTIFSWFLRTRIPMAILRILFAQRYYVLLSMPRFKLNVSSLHGGIVCIEQKIPTGGIDLFGDKLFGGSFAFKSHLLHFYGLPPTINHPFVKCSAENGLLQMDPETRLHPSIVLRSNLFLESFMMPGLRLDNHDCDIPISRATAVLYEDVLQTDSITPPFSLSYPIRGVDVVKSANSTSSSRLRPGTSDDTGEESIRRHILEDTAFRRGGCVITNASLFTLYATENHPCIDPFSLKHTSYLQREDSES